MKKITEEYENILDDLKKQLQIDDNYIEDDIYLELLLKASCEAVARHLNVASLHEIENEDGETPAPVYHAVLLLASNLYNQREPVSDKSLVKVPLSYDYLLSTYIKY